MKLRILAVVSVCCALIVVFLDATFSSENAGGQVVSQVTEAEVHTPVEKRRAEEQTFLTFPEWFLVYSSDEYADLVQTRPPSEFPFLEHIGQFWQGYSVMHRATKDDYVFNSDYHVMIMVIGTSTTIECGMKWAYEATTGRLAEATSLYGTTAEDQLAADIAREYVDFLDIEPWYKFDYDGALKRLWTETPLIGPGMLRKWERRYALTTEYALKSVYARAIRQGSESAYGVVEPVTTVLVDRVTRAAYDELQKATVVSVDFDHSALVELPRYQPFSDCAIAFARHDINFIEIAGNRNAILITAIVNDDFALNRPILMTQPILTRPGRQRIALTVPVGQLTAAINKLTQLDGTIEHVYDY